MSTNGNDWMYHSPDSWTQVLDDQDNAQAWAHQQQLEEQQMAFKHDEGRGSGWTNESENPKAPKLKGSMCWKGEQINWALWKNVKRKETDPDWGIKLEEPREEKFSPEARGPDRSWSKPKREEPKKEEDDFPF